MAVNKKGFTYIVVASLVVVVALLIFTTNERYTLQDKQAIHAAKVRSLNDFVASFNQDIVRASYISSFRALVALEDYVATNGVYLTDMNESFREVFYYGTIDGDPHPLMNDSSLSDYINRTNILAHSVGLSVEANVSRIALTHINPWTIQVEIEVDANITDRDNLAYWSFNKTYYADVPIYNLRDPLYSVNTNNKVPNTIRQLNVTELVTDDNDTTNLLELINGSYYLASEDAPSFLNRFEGKTDPDPNGIESIVFISALSDQNIDVYEDRVKVDYLYFTDTGYSERCDFDGVPANYYFVIPADKLDLYEVSGLNYSTTC